MSNSRDPKDVNLLFERSKFSNLWREDKAGGTWINLLLATFNVIRALNLVISEGKFLILLCERSRYSKQVRRPISGGKYLQNKEDAKFHQYFELNIWL